jgi:hypothetical protein
MQLRDDIQSNVVLICPGSDGRVDYVKQAVRQIKDLQKGAKPRYDGKAKLSNKERKEPVPQATSSCYKRPTRYYCKPRIDLA